QEAHQYLLSKDYTKAASLYEQAIAEEPEVKSHYWNLGLMLLLDGQEVEAQTTWLLAMAADEDGQVENWTVELINVLQEEANRQETLTEYAIAWAIRQHIREISPTYINNLLSLVKLANKLEIFTGDELVFFGLIELLRLEPEIDLDKELLLQVLKIALDKAFLHSSIVEFVEACLVHIQKPISLLEVLLPASIHIAYSAKYPGIAAQLLELYLRLEPGKLEVLRHLACFHQNAGNYEQGIETAKLCNAAPQSLPDKIFSTYLVIRGLMNAGGHWPEAKAVSQEQELLLSSLFQEQPTLSESATIQRLFNSTFFLPYFQDNLQKNRSIQNQIARLAQVNVCLYAKEQSERYNQRAVLSTTKPLKIGYLSHCLRSHSVGWLARGLFKHHDKERFQIYGYFVNDKRINDPLHQWYISKVDQAYQGETNGLKIAEKIYSDEIDILIDLDSITLDTSCEVLSLKPAPVQATWLGWDASGVPAIDYFIADPYVLPESAQNYYQEKIWRLPQTYIAVDGFEVAVPTLRRDQLDIPSDAVVYLSAQRGYKRCPETIKWQMKIIKEVPNSYFLIKGLANEESVKSFFTKIAEEEGVDCDRLRFLPEVVLESVHRANLAIADVVLDTYPYNGATTTLETLWMCIPLVTRVGQQFA
ncbi:MAG: O-linked N-acetylglucosamine transferase, SPINDLY family protein, partial [Coleofasciculaceae cyanobacterium]